MSSLYYNEEDRPKSTPANAEHVFIDGDCLVVPHGYEFPQICLVTGETVDDPPRAYKFLQSTSAVTGLTLDFWKILFAQFFRQKAKVSFCLSRRVLKKRRLLQYLAAGLIVTAIIAPIALVSATDNPAWLLLFPVCLVAGMLTSWWRDRYVRSEKVTSSYVWLAGIHPTVRQEIYDSGKT